MKKEDLTETQHELKLKEIPSWFEMFSYLFTPLTCLGGPFFEYTYYKKFIEKTGKYQELSIKFKGPFLAYASGFFLIAFHELVTGIGFSPDEGTKESFMEHSYAYKMFWSHMACISIRLKYYVIYRFQAAALMASGLSYSGQDE